MSACSCSGFVSGGSGVVCRPLHSGAVWVWRAGLSRAGFPFPAAVCFPFVSFSAASRWAARAAFLGFAVSPRRARRCAAAFEVKLVFSPGLSVSVARARLVSVGLCRAA